jgi:hypothetical protein
VAAPPFEVAAGVVTDPALVAIADRLAEGRRLSAEDGAYLFRTPDLLGLGALADAKRGQRVLRTGFCCVNGEHGSQHTEPGPGQMP